LARESLHEKQAKILETIFEHLLSSGRKDLVDAYEDVTRSYTKETFPKARRKWKCGKCKKTIEIGEKYFCKTIADRNFFNSKRLCLECANKKEKKIEKQQHKKMRFIQGDSCSNDT
jgi:hypothetical protein